MIGRKRELESEAEQIVGVEMTTVGVHSELPLFMPGSGFIHLRFMYISMCRYIHRKREIDK